MGDAENPENPYSFLSFLNGQEDITVSFIGLFIISFNF